MKGYAGLAFLPDTAFPYCGDVQAAWERGLGIIDRKLSRADDGVGSDRVREYEL